MKILPTFLIIKILFFALIVAAAATTTISAAASEPNLRGVMTSLRDKYSSSIDTAANTFTCLDGSKSIKLSRLNDDFCDCADGSDEPGTAACTFPASGSLKTDLIARDTFRFQCTNAGFENLNQQFFHSRINDGVCDCCDGSDEYLFPGKCPNRCEVYSAERQQEETRREVNRQAGLKAKAELLAKATRLREEWKQEVVTLEGRVDSLKKELEAAEVEVVRLEAIESAKRNEIREESLKKKEVWEAEQAEKKAKREAEEAAKQQQKEQEIPVEQQQQQEQEKVPGDDQNVDATAAAAETDGTKIECVYWRQTGGCSGSGGRERQGDRTCDQIIEGGHSGYCECKADGADETYPFDCGHRPLRCDTVCMFRGADEGFEDPAPPSSAEPVTRAFVEETFTVDDGSSYHHPEATDARRKRDDARHKLTSTEDSIKTRNADLQKEYGPDNVFLGLADDCFEKRHAEFTYKLCPMKEAYQSHTSLGKFKSFATQTYGSWGGKEDFSKQVYEGGTHCWGGPARSCEVVLVCGPENEIKSVEEPSMCAYKMVFQTPAICE